MTETWIKGDDYREKGAGHITYGIHNTVIPHGNAVEVYTSAADRDIILEALNKAYEK